MADDLTNLNPSSTREWLQHLNRRFDDLEESQAEDRDTFLRILDEHKQINQKMDERIKTLESCGVKNVEKIDQLEKKVNGWNVINSLGVAIAAILAALGLRGS